MSGWLRWLGTALATAVLATVVGAAAAWGPGRLAHGDALPGVVGTAVLALTLAALVVLWRARTRGRRWWVRWPAALVGLVIVVLLALPAGIATWAAFPARPQVPLEAPPGAVEARVPAEDGTVLAGWYLPGGNGAGLVVAHGASGTRASVLPQAQILARHGYSLLLLDARGHGGSDGRPMALGWWGESDLEAAVTWLSAQPEVDPERIGLVGLSMGGEEAIGAAGADPRVAAVVAEGATGRTAADKDTWLPRHPAGYVQRGIDVWRDVLTGLLTAAPRPAPLASAVARSSAPMLLVAAGTVPDETVAADVLAAAGGDRVTVWTVPGAGHIGALATDPSGWEDNVVGLLDSALG